MSGAGCIKLVAEVSAGYRWQAKSSQDILGSGSSPLFSDRSKQVRSQCDQNLEKGLSHRVPGGAWQIWQRAVQTLGGICAEVIKSNDGSRCEKQLLEAGREALTG